MTCNIKLVLPFHKCSSWSLRPLMPASPLWFFLYCFFFFLLLPPGLHLLVRHVWRGTSGGARELEAALSSAEMLLSCASCKSKASSSFSVLSYWRFTEKKNIPAHKLRKPQQEQLRETKTKGEKVGPWQGQCSGQLWQHRSLFPAPPLLPGSQCKGVLLNHSHCVQLP